jgi:uncharacterized protein (DUF2252 family)
MRIVKATREYESWLANYVSLVTSDLAQKHVNMCSDPFIFLRATFYRWAQRFPEVCPEFQDLPKVLSINDLHIENFGTWRDGEGRLVWGVNDFDEAYPNVFAADLVRLATSTFFAIEAGHLQMSRIRVCKALLAGYIESIKSGGLPFVLQEGHPELRVMAMSRLKEPSIFWGKFDAQMKTPNAVPASARQALQALFPEKGLKYRAFHRQAGQGSLGRQRFVGMTNFRGGRIAREVKALVPSACVFALGKESKKIYYTALINSSVRCPDPFLSLDDNWIGRRLAPDCSRIDLTALPKVRDEQVLLSAMGFETGNIHLGSPDAISELLKALRKLPEGWLLRAAEAMYADTLVDFKMWRKEFRTKI